jgi:hypothetical protein
MNEKIYTLSEIKHAFDTILIDWIEKETMESAWNCFVETLDNL